MSAPLSSPAQPHNLNPSPPMKTSGRIRRVRAASTSNITIATALIAGQAIDGVTLAEGDEVLVAGQTTASQNGVYVAHATQVKRSYNFDTANELTDTVIEVVEGTANKGTQWRAIGITDATAVGTDSLSFARTRGGYLAKSIAGGAGTTTLTAAEASNDVLELTGAITGNRVVEVPAYPTKQWTVFNNTTGAFTVTVKVTGQTGIVVASTKTAILYSNGTDVERATADA